MTASSANIYSRVCCGWLGESCGSDDAYSRAIKSYLVVTDPKRSHDTLLPFALM